MILKPNKENFFKKIEIVEHSLLRMHSKEFNLLDALYAGKIPVISDGQLRGAAKILCGSGFSNICDWHSEQKCVEGGGDRILKKFDPDSPEKWKVNKMIHCPRSPQSSQSLF